MPDWLRTSARTRTRSPGCTPTASVSPGLASSSGRRSVIVAGWLSGGSAGGCGAIGTPAAAPWTAVPVGDGGEGGSGSLCPLPGRAGGGGACVTWAGGGGGGAGCPGGGGAGAAGSAGGAAAAAASAISGVMACTSPVGSQRRYSPHWQKSWSAGFSRPQLWQVLILVRLQSSSWPPSPGGDRSCVP